MSGNRAGGLKAAETIRQNFGEGYWADIGRKGGSVSHPETRVFFMDRDLARTSGIRGGRNSKRPRRPDVNR